MGDLSMFSYAWDFQENGVTKTVDELFEIGINTVTLACAYHAGKFLRPKGKNGKIYFPEDGTTYFKTNPKYYGAIKPIANSLDGHGQVLSELITRRDLKVKAWFVLLHNSRHGSEQIESTVQNAFGDPYIYALCPSAPDAREFGVGLLKDLSENNEVDGLTVESMGFPPFDHGYHHEFSFIKPNKWLSSYLGLCFCKHCVAGAKAIGIDADFLKGKVAKNIEDYLSGDVDFPTDMAEAFWLADVAANSELRAFLDFRNEVVTSFVKELKGNIGKELELSIIPSVARPTSGAWYEGSDLTAIAEITGVIEACFYEPETERIRADLVDIKRRTQGVGKLKGIIRPAFPDLPSRSSVISAVQALTAGGVNDIGFYNYGHLRSQSLEWISDALKSKGSAL